MNQSSKSVDPMLVLGKAVDMSVKVRGGDFPLGALPMKIQRIVREANDCYGYPVDYLAGSMLVAVGLGIGNTHFARLKGNTYKDIRRGGVSLRSLKK